jgi:ABC-type glycerol-3-phosphate transport system permease component
MALAQEAVAQKAVATRPARRPAWEEKPSLLVRVAKAIVLVLIGIVMLYPFVYVISVSLSTARAAAAGPRLFPTEFSLAAYKLLLSGGIVTRALAVSVGITTVGTALSVVFTVLMAYGLMRTRDVPGAKFILYLVLLTMLFSAGIIPNYLVVKQLGLIDTYAGLIVAAYPGFISAFNLVVVRNFFMELPQDLFDSARLDGASEWQVLWRVVLPLSKAVIAVIALFYGVAYWNDFFTAMIYINDTAKWPVQLVLQQYVLQGTPMDTLAQNNPTLRQTTPQTIQMAIVVLSTLPILIVYPFVQRFFTKGVLTGAVKG